MSDDMCQAMSDPHGSVTVYVAGEPVTTPAHGGWFICTQHPDHRGGHSACDGQGHKLAEWPRRRPEQYWHPADCAGCTHHDGAVTS